MAFLFTVLGEWYVEGKVISRGMFLFSRISQKSSSLTLIEDTGIGMALSLGGIALCVQSKR